MKKNIPLIPDMIEIVCTRGELSFQEVLDDFPNASFIGVITYNISSKQKQLIKLLEEHSSHADIRLITNIPSRFDHYKGDASKTAKRKIETFMNRLDPNILGISTFFHFNLHSKIIMTENIAYIGSGNFSEESAKSWETGLLIKNSEFVNSIRENLLPLFNDEAIQYFGGTLLDEKVLHYAYLAAKAVDMIDMLQEQLYTFVEIKPWEEVLTYNQIDPQLSVTNLEILEKLLEEIDNELDDVKDKVGTIPPLFDRIIDDIRLLIDDTTPIYRLAEFNPLQDAEDYLSNRMIHPEELDSHAQYASQRASEKLWKKAGAAKNDTEILFNKLQDLVSALQNAVDEFNRLKKLESSIDNTN